MKKRYKMRKKGSKKLFRRTASRTHRLNNAKSKRGGIRL